MKTVRSLAALLILGAALVLPVACGGGGGDQEAQKAKPEKKAESAQTEGTSPSAAASATAYTPNPEHGKQLFLQVCSACHGPDAKGLPNLGKDLTTSKFIQEKTDQELLAFVKQGRSPTDPLNTTGIAMPPKGGNPALTDQDILDIISYIRTLQVKPVP